MNDKATVPTTFWIIAGLALLWNLMGLYAFYSDMTITQETLDAMEAGQRGLYENFPIWKKVAYGAATIFGFLGSLGLVLRKSWAAPLFLISLLGVIVQSAHNIFMTNSMEVLGMGAMIMQLVILAIAGFLYYYSRNCSAKGWLT